MGRGLAVATLAVWAAACSSAPTTRELAQNALTAMGGEQRVRAIQSVEMSGGTGSRSRLGQGASDKAPEDPATLINVVETIDLAGQRAALAYELTTAGGFSQRRKEILTRLGDRPIGLEDVQGRPLAAMSPAGLFSWGTQNSPLLTLRRNIIAVALAAASAETTQVSEDRVLGNRTLSFGKTILGDESIGVYFDPDTGLIAAFEALDTETMLGDLTAVYIVEDYRDVGGVQLPHRIRILKGDAHYSDVQFSGAAINNATAMRVFDIPESAAGVVAQALEGGSDYTPLQLTAIGDKVFFAQAYSHHSVVVEFPSYLAVVEAPYTEAQSRTLVKLLAARFPDKPVRYAAITHPHFDHTGGVRGMAAAGATILATRGHEKQIRSLLDARHTNPADTLDTNRATGGKVGRLTVFDGKHVLSEGDQALELYAVTGSPHADPVVIAYVPSAGLLFQSDLYFPATGSPGTPDAAHLLESVRKLGLKPTVHAGGHGGVAPFEELEKAVGTMPAGGA